MRMWMLSPKLLCRKHLLGEHVEIHKHRHNFVKKQSIQGRMSPIVLIEPYAMEVRHNELVEEMLIRGYKHNSPYSLPDLSHLPAEVRNIKVDKEYNIKDLTDRCPECRERYEILYNKR
jgi:hypothetical protein